MAVDLNQAPEQRDIGAVIPDGTFVKLKAALRPGGNNLPGADQIDSGLFKQSASSDAIMLDWEFVVLHGTYAKRKIFQLTTVAGGSVDEKGQSKSGNITKSMLRAMLDSGLGIDPKDMSDGAKAKRILRGFSDFDGIEFAARIGIEKGGNRPDGGTYPDKNRIAHVVTPNEPEWQPVMAGQEVAAKPSGAISARAATPQTSTRPWATQTAPASSGPSWTNGHAAPTEPAGQPAAAASGPAWMRG